MYFSNNSRYVFRKARLLSPGCLNKIGKNLSIKKPKDDPTKPPLRINIPNEDREDILRKKVPGEVRKAGTSSVYQDDVFRKSDEIHFSNVDGMSASNKMEESSKVTSEHLNSLTSNRVGYTYKSTNSGDGMSFDRLSSIASNKTEKREKKAAGEESKEKSWYILLDINPKNKEVEVLRQTALSGEKFTAEKKQNIVQIRPKTPKVKKTENLLHKAKYVSKFSYNKVGRKPSRFEVHEVEDEATYILYVKLNKQLQKKPNKVGWVPEKEFTIRTESGAEQAEVAQNDFELTDSDKVRKKQKVRRYDDTASVESAVQESNAGMNLLYKEREEHETTNQDVQNVPVEKSSQIFFDKSESVNAPSEKIQKAEVEENAEFLAGGDQSVFTATNAAEMPKVEASTPTTPTPDVQTTSTTFPSVVEQLLALQGKSSKTKINEAVSVSSEKAVAAQETSNVQHEETPPAAVLSQETVYAAAEETVQPPAKEASMAPAQSSESPPQVDVSEPPSSAALNIKATSLLNVEKPKDDKEKEEKKYLSIHDKVDEVKPEQKPSTTDPLTLWKASEKEKLSVECSEHDIKDFQTSGGFVSIGRTETSTYPMTFGAAFPPLLKEALNTQLKLRRNLNEKWKTLSKDGNYQSDSKMQNFSENSILFPKAESEGFDCDALFSTKEQIILNLIKNEEESQPKTGDITKDPDSSVDSLSVMKKVKEMVQLDLDNVVRIFDEGGGEHLSELSSVVISTKNGWEVNNEELESQMAMRRNEMKQDTAFCLKNSILEDEKSINPAKYLPSKRESTIEIGIPDEETKSVMMFNSKNNEFFICKEALAEAISRKTKEPLNEIEDTLDFFVEHSISAKDVKSGDSILVFDDETQSWKVDFSILEKRQQQIQLEKELTRRSELILENFEELEKNQITSIPKPSTKDKKTFDYIKKEWKDIKNPNEKSTKSKYPFKDANAEEIRKKNSDLYENLFVAKKKETRMENPEKKAPGVSSSSSKKESKSAGSGEKKAADSAKSDPPTKKPEASEPSSKIPPPGVTEKKEDENFWEAFLRMNILPKDVRDIPKTPLKPVPVPDKNKSDKKIEVPILKIPNPFQRRTSVTKKESGGEAQQSISKKITPPPPPPSKNKVEKPGIKAPPPPNQISKEEPKKTELPKQSPKIDPPKSEISKFPPVLDKNAPKSEPSKTDPPKPTPKLDPSKPVPKVDPPTTPPKTDPPKADPPKAPPKSDPPKPNPKLEPPKQSPKSGKILDSKTPTGKSASPPADHYVSDKIIEISRTKGKDLPKGKTKIETVKLNLTPDTRLPSKITEINLNKKFEVGKPSKTTQKPPNDDTQSFTETFKKPEESAKEKKPLCNNFEKYRTPFSDPEYEEKSMKIKSDIASNPNLKKLDNWNKTLVLHDIMKPPENVESWLKDETDKMATLLLKILQEASDGKPKKKHFPIKPKPENLTKGNPYENIRKKQENTPESFFFRVRTVNFSLENEKKKSMEDIKPVKTKRETECPAQTMKPSKPGKIQDGMKDKPEKSDIPTATILTSMKTHLVPANSGEQRVKTTPWKSESVEEFYPTPKESLHSTKIVDVTEEIPGPEILKKISNMWKLLPVVDSQITILTLFKVFQLVNMGRSILNPLKSNEVKSSAFSKLFAKYGPIVNIKGPLSGNIILIHKSEHLSAIFDQDSTMFVRSVFDSMEQIRKESDEKSASSEMASDWNSPRWTELKKVTNDSSIRGCERYLPTTEIAVNSLIGIIKKNRNSQDMVSEDFMEEIKRWSLEGLCSVLFEKSLGFMDGRLPNTNWVLETDKLCVAIDKANQYLRKCEQGFQLWRLMPTPSALGLSQAYNSVSSFLMKQIHQAGMNLKNKNELLKEGGMFRVKDLTLVESMMLNDGLSNEEISCNLVDILLIGTNLVNSTIGFLLYNLAINARVQSKLFHELKEALPMKYSHLDYNKLVSLKYLQACFKENLRLHTPIPLFSRLLQNDILLSNYFIPKGTHIVIDQRVSNQKEYLFENPEKFLPERWLSEDKSFHDNESLSFFPLCHGPRAEFAKKLIELQLCAFMAKIIRNFHIEYHFGEIQNTNNLINFPDKPLKLNFIEREL